jgi:hypothetical protein
MQQVEATIFAPNFPFRLSLEPLQSSISPHLYAPVAMYAPSVTTGPYAATRRDPAQVLGLQPAMA